MSQNLFCGFGIRDFWPGTIDMKNSGVHFRWWKKCIFRDDPYECRCPEKLNEHRQYSRAARSTDIFGDFPLDKQRERFRKFCAFQKQMMQQGRGDVIRDVGDDFVRFKRQGSLEGITMNYCKFFGFLLLACPSETFRRRRVFGYESIQ